MLRRTALWLLVALTLVGTGRARLVEAQPVEVAGEARGPEGGLILQLVRDPLDPATVYAVSRADLWRSRDGGLTWKAVGPGLMPQVGRLAIDPSASTTLYLGQPNGDLVKSTDGGAS